MVKKSKLRVLWLILTIIFCVLTIISIVGAAIANKYSAALNSYFDVLNYTTIDIGEDEEVDTEYFKSSFVTQNGNYDDAALYDYDLRVAQQITNEGSVLLWNNNKALPLEKGSAVSCFSNTSVNAVYTGTGSGSISVKNAVNLKDALLQYDFEVNDKLWNFYSTGAGSASAGYGITQKGSNGISTNEPLYTNEVPWSVIEGAGIADTFSQYGDAAIFVLGRSGGEGGDLSFTGSPDTIDGNYLQLSDVERNVIDNLINLKNSKVFDRVILLINSANAMQMDIISEYAGSIDACLWIGQPGAGGMPGIAKLLCGEANPSGKLVDTYVYDNSSSPAMANFYLNRYSNAGEMKLDAQDTNTQTAYTVYQEGIYIGYKYYETRYEDVVLGQGNAGDYDYSETVAYPFGYGLSYTSFSFSEYSVSQNKDGDYLVSVTVTNTGNVPGRQVAQTYLQKPYTAYDVENGIEKASVELVGYAKTGILEAGESETLTVIVDDYDFKSYDFNGYKTYIREAGDYYIAVGENAHDALNNILAAKKNAGVAVNDSLMVNIGGANAAGNASFAHKITFKDTDAETYSVSPYTGKQITNQFNFADINRYDGADDSGIDNSVTYLTRSDWNGTMPKAAPKLKLTAAMAERLACERDLSQTAADAERFYDEHGKIEYEQNNGLSLIELKDLPYDDPKWDLLLDQMTLDEQAELCSNGYHTTALVESINKPATRDENGPLGISVTFSTSTARASMGWPCEPTRAATFNIKLNELMGKCLGEDMLHAGVNGLWGYGLNIHRTPYSGRNFEYYSEDSFLSGETCIYETIGAQSRGAFIMVKHFAANDSETQRHGNNEWMTEQTLREIYLSPFEKEFTEGGALATMTSYNRIGCEWAGGCYALCTTVLRGEWGFLGYTSSDYAGKSRDYNYYQNVYIGIQAGCDTYDANFHKDEYDDVRDNDVFRYCLRQSSKRICYSILNSAAMNGIRSTTKVVYVNTWWQNALIGLQVGLAVCTVIFAGLFTFDLVCSKKKASADCSCKADNENAETGGKTDE